MLVRISIVDVPQEAIARTRTFRISFQSMLVDVLEPASDSRARYSTPMCLYQVAITVGLQKEIIRADRNKLRVQSSG